MIFEDYRLVPGMRSLHLFAGAGTDIMAAETAGLEPRAGGNHWGASVATVSSAYDIEFHLGDLEALDVKTFRPGEFEFLFASPECDGHSTARNQREARAELKPYAGPDGPLSGIERSRCTMFCPLAYAARIRPLYVVLENVVDVCSSWAPYLDGSWVREWEKIGYRIKLLVANSAFFGEPGAQPPQSRDRAYFIAWRKDVPEPDLDYRPVCACPRHGIVRGIQTFKPVAIKRAGPLGPVGKYGPWRGSWYYRCPEAGCRDEHGGPTVALPFITPAAVAIEWDRPIQLIGDRPVGKELAENTLRRIALGFARKGRSPRYDGQPMLVPLDRLTDPASKNARPVWLPAYAQTARATVALVVPEGFQVDLRGTNVARHYLDPASTVAASGLHHAMVVQNNANNLPRELYGPVGAVTSGNRMYLAGDGLALRVGGNTFERSGYARAWPLDGEPMRAQTAQADTALAIEPGQGYVVGNYSPGHFRDATQEPTGALTAGGERGVTQQAVVQLSEAILDTYYGGTAGRSIMAPAGTVPGHPHQGLAVPYDEAFLARAGGTRQADTAALDGPSPTRMPTESYGLAEGGRGDIVDLEQVGFRMLEPSESQRLMNGHVRRIPQPDGTFRLVPYELKGSKRDRTALAGNGITPDVEVFMAQRAIQAIAA